MAAMRSPVERPIWFIESHSAKRRRGRGLRTVPVSDLTAVQRRLTEAARALAEGAPDILAVAVEAGYSSREASTRAFVQQFGLTPNDLRERDEPASAGDTFRYLAGVEVAPGAEALPAAGLTPGNTPDLLSVFTETIDLGRS